MAALAVLAGLAPPQVRAVRLTTLDFRPAVRVLASENMPPAEVVREGDEVVIRLPAEAPQDLALPVVERPLEGLRLEREQGRTTLRVKVAPEVPFETNQEAGMVTVVFGEQPAPELRGPVTPDLYQRLFPTGVLGAGERPGEEAAGKELGEGREGLTLGRLTLRPYATAAYVNADVLAFDNPVPVRDRYLQVAPGVTASLPVRDGLLAAEFEPRLHFFSDIPQVNEPSYFAGAKLETPVGSRVLLRIGERYTRATLETTVVDPGREYFFNLTRYTFNDTTVAARIEVGARLWLDADGGWRRARFDQSQTPGFFDYDTRTGRVGLGYDVGTDLRATVSYGYESIPPSEDRAIVETSAHDILAGLSGRIGPLTQGAVSVGFRTQSNPQAAGASRTFTGVTLGGSLQRELGHSTNLGLAFNRSTDPSSFETNAYYVTNSVTVSLNTPLPLGLSARGSFSLFRNNYPNAASAIGVPRRDDLLAWTIGVGRQIGWRTWLRGDYWRDRRNSNLPGYDVTTDGFIIQLGIGLFGQGAARQ
jgi:hypothetical protein